MAKSSSKKNMPDKRTVSGKRGKLADHNRSRASGSSEKDTNNKEIWGIVLLAVGVLSFASIIFPTEGALLSWIQSLFRGIGGQLCLLLPLLFCALGIFILFGGENTFLSRKMVACGFVIFVLVETLLQSSQLIGNDSWPAYVMNSFKYSVNSVKGGGAIGSLLAWPLIKAFDSWGCRFVSVIGVVIALMTATGFSFGPVGNKLSEILDDLRVSFSNRWSDFQADREDRAREKLEARQRKLEEEQAAEEEEEELPSGDPENGRHSLIVNREPPVKKQDKHAPLPEEPVKIDPDAGFSGEVHPVQNDFRDLRAEKIPEKRVNPAEDYKTAYPREIPENKVRVPRKRSYPDTDLYIASRDEFDEPEGLKNEEPVQEEEPEKEEIGGNITSIWSSMTDMDTAEPGKKTADEEASSSSAEGFKAAEPDYPEYSPAAKEEPVPENHPVPDENGTPSFIAAGTFGTAGIQEAPRRSGRRRVTHEDPPVQEALKPETVPEDQKEEQPPEEDRTGFMQEAAAEYVPSVTPEKSGFRVPASEEAAPEEQVIPELREHRLDSTPIVEPPKDKHESLQTEEDAYVQPPIDLLDPSRNRFDPERNAHDDEVGNKLIQTLADFGVGAKLVSHTHGPAITRYEIQPDKGVKVSRITTLADDIALNLASDGVRIEAPVPGKPVVGIEVPNKNIETVCLRDVLDSEGMKKEKSPTAVALGKGISGAPIIADMAKMPHVLIAGATGSGKSVCINTIIQSIIFRAKPSEVRLILIDPKVVELSVYNGIPHLLIPVVTDPKKASAALSWAVVEMEQRYKRFETMGVRDIKGYNAAISEGEKPMPKIIVIIDELADLMMVAPGEVEDSICRLAQLARAAGIHLVIATQRPSVNVITGVIKANIPSRIAFAVSSQIDSRTILDAGGAEKLLGKGDMLYAPQGVNKPTRVQGCFVNDDEVQRVVSFVKSNHESEYNQDVIDQLETAGEEEKKTGDEESGTGGEFADEMFRKAIDLAVDAGQVSISMLQRRLRVGYARAGRLVDEMTEKGITAEAEGPTKPRKVLITREEWNRMQENM